MTLRSDLIIKELLAYLDAKVGKDRYVVVVSADHGVAPIPEVARQQGKPGARLSVRQLTGKAAEHLQQHFAPQDTLLPWILAATDEGWIYLNHGVLGERKLSAAKVEQVLADWLREQAGVLAAYTRTRLAGGPFTDDPIGESVRGSFFPDRSGDVAVVLQPYHVAMSWGVHGTNHGSPHPYDTHVPLLVYGCGIRPGIHTEPVTPLAAAAIVARAMGLPPPRGAMYPVPEGLFR
jgi:arylsulfatase A-like enzyme